MDDLKRLCRIENIPYWKIAAKIGVCEMTIVRWMRGYDPEHHDKILHAIRDLKQEQ